MCPTLCYSQENGTSQPSVPSLSPMSPHEKCLFDLETGHFLMYFQAESDSLH